MFFVCLLSFGFEGFWAITRHNEVGEVPGWMHMNYMILTELPKPSRTPGHFNTSTVDSKQDPLLGPFKGGNKEYNGIIIFA